MGNAVDHDSPMMTTSRTTYKQGHSGPEILAQVDAIVKEVREHGVTNKELADAKVRFRSNFYDEIESTNGRANLLAALALFRDDPARVNKIVEQYNAVTAAQVQDVAKKYLVSENRTAIDRVPEAK